MASFLKGNYRLDNEPTKKTTKERATPKLTAELEESALARLGGSMCFVIKGKTFMWTGDESEAPSQ